MFRVYEFQVKLGTHILTSERVAVKVCQTVLFSFRIWLDFSNCFWIVQESEVYGHHFTT